MRTRLRRPQPGYNGWLAVGAVVIAAEYLDGRTMSEAFRELSRRRITGPVLIAGWLMLTAHLFGLLPEKTDPFRLALRHAMTRREADDRC